MQTQFSNSSYQAKAILGAWHSGDANRLEAELNRVKGLKALDSADEEKLELLAELAHELRNTNPGDAVCGSLLEHLAFAGQPARRRTIRVSESARAAAATALQ
jgi:hypothetical protein